MSKTSDKIMLRPGIKMTYGVTYHSLKFLRFLIRPLVKKYVDTSMNHHYQKMFKELFTNNKNGLNIFNIKQTNKQNIEKRISRFSYKLLLKNISSIKKNELIANTNSIASELTTKSMKYVQEQLFYENSEKKLKEIITEFKHEILKSTNKTTYELIKQIVDYYFKSEQNHVLFKTYEFVTNRKAKNDKITKKLNDNSKKDFLNDIVTLKYFYLVAEDFISKLNYVHEEKTILYYLITKTEEIPVGALKIEFYGNSFYE
ncbi:hypothetical protein K9K83_06020, partial [Candidatus Woesearchaeota archaeon]|nr:hypothetical protein [Candidatus Woesearchaeota archaeon]